jgi:hypothetical protein
MALYHKWDVKNDFAYVLKFFSLISGSLGSVVCSCIKGQLVLKANCQAVNSSKKRTNEFIFTTMRGVFVRFLEKIEDSKNAF